MTSEEAFALGWGALSGEFAAWYNAVDRYVTAETDTPLGSLPDTTDIADCFEEGMSPRQFAGHYLANLISGRYS